LATIHLRQRQTGQTEQDRQRSDSTGRIDLQTVTNNGNDQRNLDSEVNSKLTDGAFGRFCILPGYRWRYRRDTRTRCKSQSLSKLFNPWYESVNMSGSYGLATLCAIFTLTNLSGEILPNFSSRLPPKQARPAVLQYFHSLAIINLYPSPLMAGYCFHRRLSVCLFLR